jgi:hypothetical protein
MRPATILTMFVLIIGPLATLATAQNNDAPPPDLADNAALDYWQATYFMTCWTEGDWKIVDNFDAAKVDKDAAEPLLDSASIRFIRQGAQQRWCDWGLRLDEDGRSTLLPYLNTSRRMAELLLLDARTVIPTSRADQAALDWQCALCVARHAGCNGISVSLLVDYGIENMVVKNAALDLNGLKPPNLERLRGALHRLPPGGTLSQGVQIDQQINQRWLLPHLQKIPGPNGQQALIALLAQYYGSGASAARAHAAVSAAGGSVDGLTSRLQALDPLYARIANAVVLPYDEFQKQWPEIQRQIDADPVAQFAVTGNYPRLVHSQATASANLALFDAAIDILLNSPDVLHHHLDPFGNGPFTYHQTATGFELSSALTNDDGTPIMIKIGRDPSF